MSVEENRETDGAFEGVKGVASAAGKTAVAAALVGAVTTGAAAVVPDESHLPTPVPIVQVIDQDADAADTVVDDQEDKKDAAWKRILQVLKYALLALFFAAMFVFGVLQGCASCVGPLAVPAQTSDSSAAQEAA